MKRIFSLLLLSVIASVSAWAASPQPTLQYVKGKPHHAKHHHAHKADHHKQHHSHRGV